jgi:hypothetical protein
LQTLFFMLLLAHLLLLFLRKHLPNHTHAHPLPSCNRLMELGQPGLHPLFVKAAITLACDRKERERELVSSLLVELHPSVITPDQVRMMLCSQSPSPLTRYKPVGGGSSHKGRGA